MTETLERGIHRICSVKTFCKTHKKILVGVSVLTKSLQHRYFPTENFYKIFTYIYFEDHLQTTASNYNVTKMKSDFDMFFTIALHNSCSLTNLLKSNSGRLFMNYFTLIGIVSVANFQHVFIYVLNLAS